MNVEALSNTATELVDTPFLPGFNAVAVNFTSGDLVVQGSDDGDTFTDLATVPATGMIGIDSLPKHVKVKTSATVYLLGGV